MLSRKGQAILEYILLVLMFAVTMAVIIRSSNRTIYGFWSAIAYRVAVPCADCNSTPPPDLP